MTASRKADIRKVVIAFDAVPVGKNLARWAFQTCLFPDDAVSLICCINPKVPFQRDFKLLHGDIDDGAGLVEIWTWDHLWR